jgi:putative inorganic carbon (HCO3(-)) transporter
MVALAAPLLLFPTFRPAWTAGVLAGLLLVWLLRWLGTGRPGRRTLLNPSLLLLAIMVPPAVWVSALPELTLPKLTGLILGLAAWRATVNAVHTPRSLGWAVVLFLGLGLGLAAFGLVSTQWANKWPVLGPVLARIPALVEGLPGAEDGVNANELAGTVLFFLPVALGLACSPLAEDRAKSVVARRRSDACPEQRRAEAIPRLAAGDGFAPLAMTARKEGNPVPGGQARALGWVGRLAALLLAAFFGAVLVLTQSRSAWLGAVLGLGVMAWLRWPRARGLLVGTGLLVALGLQYVGPQAALQSVFESAGPAGAGRIVQSINLQDRIEIWGRAVCVLRDSPLTGCGLGTFRQMVQALCPTPLIRPGGDIAHAHNVFMQVALDLGLPGLVAYLGLVGTALWMAVRVARSSGAAGSPRRGLALGLAGSLVAFHVYGLTDAIALGAKPGVALWLVLALSAVVWEQE